MTERRGGCGRDVEGGTEGCKARYEALLARDYEEPAFFAAHRAELHPLARRWAEEAAGR